MKTGGHEHSEEGIRNFWGSYGSMDSIVRVPTGILSLVQWSMLLETWLLWKTFALLDQFSEFAQPGDKSHQVEAKGNVARIYNGEIKRIINVLHVPGVTKNLLSVGSITDKNCLVIFDHNYCWVVNDKNTDMVLAKGKRDPSNSLSTIKYSVHSLTSAW